MSDVKAVLVGICIKHPESCDGLIEIRFRDPISRAWWSDVVEPGTTIDDDLIEDMRLQAEIAIAQRIAADQCQGSSGQVGLLRTALEQYGCHQSSCAFLRWKSPCTCGLDAARKL